MKEHWKNIRGYPGYWVSNYGRVYGPRKGVMTPCVGSSGYGQVNLVKDKAQRTFRVHQLVATAFVPKRGKVSRVAHINKVKSDNNAGNLRWV